MTLIYSALGNGLLTLSDLVTSTPATSDGSPVHIPFHVDGLRHTAGGFRLAGVAQKTFIADKTLIQWSGSMAVAKAAISAAYDASCAGANFIDVPSVLAASGLSASELSQVSLIYHFSDDNMIRRYSHDCLKATVGAADVVCGGSGVWDFVENTVATHGSGGDSAAEIDFFGTLGKAFYGLISEAWSTNNYDYLYGGWLEISIDEHRRFQKLPYAIKFWQRNQKGLNLSLPIFFSSYVGNDLVICRADVVDGGVNTYIHTVTDFLDRPGGVGDGIPSVRWEPRVMVHVLNSEGDDRFELIIKKDQDRGVDVEIDNRTGAMKNVFSKKFVEELAKGPITEPGPFFDVSKLH